MFSLFSKILILGGVFLILIGILFSLNSRTFLFFGKLPGDVYIKKDNFVLFAPITSFLILSIILSIVIWIIFKTLK